MSGFFDWLSDVSGFLQKSRLHFIGTWRNRYRKRFLTKVESKCSHGTDSGPRSTYIMHIDMVIIGNSYFFSFSLCFLLLYREDQR